MVRLRLDVRSCGVLASVSCLLPAPAFWLGCLTSCCGPAAFSGSLPCTQNSFSELDHVKKALRCWGSRASCSRCECWAMRRRYWLNKPDRRCSKCGTCFARSLGLPSFGLLGTSRLFLAALACWMGLPLWPGPFAGCACTALGSACLVASALLLPETCTPARHIHPSSDDQVCLLRKEVSAVVHMPQHKTSLQPKAVEGVVDRSNDSGVSAELYPHIAQVHHPHAASHHASASVHACA